MRDYKAEYEGRVAFIRELVKNAGASGIVYGNSGGKDSTLVGILCKAACDNTVGIIMPCASKRNYGQDTDDGIAVAGSSASRRAPSTSPPCVSARWRSFRRSARSTPPR